MLVARKIVCVWSITPWAKSGSVKDLNLFKELSLYPDKAVSKTGIIKKKIVMALNKKSSEDYKNGIKIDPIDLTFQKIIADFVNHEYINFLNIFKIPTEFLKVDPKEWRNMNNYQPDLSVSIAMNLFITPNGPDFKVEKWKVEISRLAANTECLIESKDDNRYEQYNSLVNTDGCTLSILVENISITHGRIENSEVNITRIRNNNRRRQLFSPAIIQTNPNNSLVMFTSNRYEVEKLIKNHYHSQIWNK
ncbi:hypothetical protein AGLY_015860 [Aphis glycines]|uniref:Uncharacterized protein n=1 Tax=Aphis glycines TaxID=307491 RepID=A0A6G0SZH7_APHGL|nr:hypothetical protein AGLY_015860 [Aphis glycines]